MAVFNAIPDFVMLDIEDGKSSYYGGVPESNSVYINVMLHGQFDYDLKNKFTGLVFEYFQKKFGVEPHKMYLTFTEYDHWGVFGELKTESPEGT